MELKEKVAYIKGLMEGMEFDATTKEGKLLAAVVDALEEMANTVTDIDDDLDTLYDEVDAMSEDLEDVENFVFDEDPDDENDEDYGSEFEDGLYEITCPQCGAQNSRSTSAMTMHARAATAAAATKKRNNQSRLTA